MNNRLFERDVESDPLAAVEAVTFAPAPGMASREFVFFVFNREEPNKIRYALKSETPGLAAFSRADFLLMADELDR